MDEEAFKSQARFHALQRIEENAASYNRGLAECRASRIQYHSHDRRTDLTDKLALVPAMPGHFDPTTNKEGDVTADAAGAARVRTISKVYFERGSPDVYQKPATTNQRSDFPSNRGTIIPRSLRNNQFTLDISHNKLDPGSSSTIDKSSVNKHTQDPELELPSWYADIRSKDKKIKYDRAKLSCLANTRDLISNCKAESLQELATLFDKLRNQIHRIEFLEADEVLVKKSRLLECHFGLPRIFNRRFSDGIAFPLDLQEDAKTLYLKWHRRDFNPDLLRGVLEEKKSQNGGKEKYSTCLDPKYPHRLSPDHHGCGRAINGQWFPTQLCALRDGVHGAAQAGIHGRQGEGAFSVVMSSSAYDDRDEGEIIAYCGTEGSDGHMTEATKRMHESINNKQPVRVLRSHSLPATNKYRPAKGLRFDGLYLVTGSTLLSEAKAHYQFHLKRISNQAPIRYQGPYKKPNRQEVEEYNKHRVLSLK